jgi:hypothetical protein
MGRSNIDTCLQVVGGKDKEKAVSMMLSFCDRVFDYVSRAIDGNEEPIDRFGQ